MAAFANGMIEIFSCENAQLEHKKTTWFQKIPENSQLQINCLLWVNGGTTILAFLHFPLNLFFKFFSKRISSSVQLPGCRL